jgi:hypothetical protein
MLLFRSEEELAAWDGPRGATLPVGRLHELARRWYGDRLDPEWRPRTAAESQRILDSVGLHDAFWRL